MLRDRLKVEYTEKDNLVSNLRAEVGGIIETWILYRHILPLRNELVTDDVKADLENRHLAYLSALVDKLENEIIARLSELAERKTGQLTFHFAAMKLDALRDEERDYRKFIHRQKFKKKRNWYISHKRLPCTWADHQRAIDIPYSTIVKGIAKALRIMKKIDRLTLGPSAPFCWREMRKRRYDLVPPARVAYLLLPHLYLSGEDRLKIMVQEEQAGEEIWSVVDTIVDERPARVRVCRKWGAVDLGGGRIKVLRHYPLQELVRINTRN